MKRILFVCHGNICRSPMAEFVMKDLVKKAGLENQFQIASAATSTEELGNPVYPPARRKLAEHGIRCAGKTARQLRPEEYAAWDLLLGMDRANLRSMNRICGGDPEGKIRALLEYAASAQTDSPVKPKASSKGNGKRPTASPQTEIREVADPWYTGDFEVAYRDILAGCEGLLAVLTEKGGAL